MSLISFILLVFTGCGVQDNTEAITIQIHGKPHDLECSYISKKNMKCRKL